MLSDSHTRNCMLDQATMKTYFYLTKLGEEKRAWRKITLNFEINTA